MTVEELIARLRDLDPRARVVLTEEHPKGIVRGVEVVDVYEAKGVDQTPGHAGYEDVEFLRLYRLGTPGAKVEFERVVVLDDKVRK